MGPSWLPGPGRPWTHTLSCLPSSLPGPLSEERSLCVVALTSLEWVWRVSHPLEGGVLGQVKVLLTQPLLLSCVAVRLLLPDSNNWNNGQLRALVGQLPTADGLSLHLASPGHPQLFL